MRHCCIPTAAFILNGSNNIRKAEIKKLEKNIALIGVCGKHTQVWTPSIISHWKSKGAEPSAGGDREPH